jgi:hypothetical protein
VMCTCLRFRVATSGVAQHTNTSWTGCSAVRARASVTQSTLVVARPHTQNLTLPSQHCNQLLAMHARNARTPHTHTHLSSCIVLRVVRVVQLGANVVAKLIVQVFFVHGGLGVSQLASPTPIPTAPHYHKTSVWSTAWKTTLRFRLTVHSRHITLTPAHSRGCTHWLATSAASCRLRHPSDRQNVVAIER